MILVEAGPWENPNESMMRLQTRLLGCVEGALNGQLAGKFPEALGKEIIIRLDCYNLPRLEITEFFERFSSGIFSHPGYEAGKDGKRYLKKISFQLNFDSIH